MKYFAFVALIVVVSAAAPVEEKKPLPTEEKKPDDKPQHGLVWPLPDPESEGDLMLHGSISYERVRDLHKSKVEDEVDKMILAHGRLFLRRVSKFFDENGDFKIIPILCRDTRNLNDTRWNIEIPKQAAAPADKVAENKEKEQQQAQNDAPASKDKNEKSDDQPRNESGSTTTTGATTVSPSSSSGPSSSGPLSSSSQAFTTSRPVQIGGGEQQQQETYEIRRRDFYRQVGANFARLLLKEYRKEQMVQEETEYLARWIADEAVHYGAVAIYCEEGENVKDIKKNLATFLEEKAQ